MPFEMDAYTTRLVTAIGLLILLGVLWVVWKFFYTVFKHVLVAIFIAAIGSGIYYYVMNQAPPPKDPSVGKHAYGAGSGRYLGEIEAVSADSFIVKFGNTQTKYPKARVTVKEQMEPVTVEAPSPSPSTSPRNKRSPPQRPR